MRSKRTVLLLVLVLAIGCVVIRSASLLPPTGRALAAPAPFPTAVFPLAVEEWEQQPLRPGQDCTTVYATDGQQMLGGNNEDYINPLTKVWFVPAEAGTFGRVYFGFESYYPQGGMNDQGLFFDGLAVDTPLAVPLEGRQPFTGTIFLDYVMARCATVACVVEMFETYYADEIWAWQHLFGDATGESAIIEPQAILRQRGGYQVATNFYQSMVLPELREHTCWRYQTATSMLEGSPTLSVEYMREVMAAVHQGVHGSPTLYTNIYDLVNRVVYLYYFFDYEHVVVIDLEAELAQGEHAYDLPSLFPTNPTAEEFTAPMLTHYNSLIRARLTEVDPAFLAAYVGEYELPEELGGPDERLRVVRHGDSLMMIFPDAHRYELFPQGETSFFTVLWRETEFRVGFDVDFGVDASGRVLYLEAVFGEDDFIRHDRLGPPSSVPYAATPIPTATARPGPAPSATSVAAATLPPAATAVEVRTSVPSIVPLTATPLPLEPVTALRFPWGWAVVPVALLAALAGWLVFRRGRCAQP